jgi:hypothetical protein
MESGSHRVHHNNKEPTGKDERWMGMLKKGFLAASVLVFAAMSWAQASSGPPAANSATQTADSRVEDSAASADKLAPGTILSVELSKSLDARKCKADNRIEVRTAADLLTHGQIVVPRNTKIIGHVTEAKARSKTSPQSLLAITFDRMLLKDGREIPLQVAVQAVGRPLHAASRQAGPGGDTPASIASSLPGDLAVPPDPMPARASYGPSVIPLNPTSQGIVGLKGLALDTSGPVSVVSSNTRNVHLDNGTQLILRVR